MPEFIKLSPVLLGKLCIVALIFSISLAFSSACAHLWCWCSNQGNTYGWHLMTPDERKEHQATLASFIEYNACKEYIDAHHKKMEARAREKSVEVQDVKDNPCDSMKIQGILK